MLYAMVSGDGSLATLFNDPAVTQLPAGATLLTQAQYIAWAQAPTDVLVNGTLQPPTTSATTQTPPSANPLITTLAYFGRFTAAETSAIHTYALTQPATANSLQVFNWIISAAAAQTINLTDATVVAGHAFLVAQGLLTQARSTVILTP